MIGGDFVIEGGDEKEGIGLFAIDFDIGFIARTLVVDFSLAIEVEMMTVGRGCFGIVEHSLIGDGNAKDLF